MSHPDFSKEHLKEVKEVALAGDAFREVSEPTKGLRLAFTPGMLGLHFVVGTEKYTDESKGPSDMAYINSLIEADERRRHYLKEPSVTRTPSNNGGIVVGGKKTDGSGIWGDTEPDERIERYERALKTIADADKLSRGLLQEVAREALESGAT